MSSARNPLGLRLPLPAVVLHWTQARKTLRRAWRPFWIERQVPGQAIPSASVLLRTTSFRQSACFAFVFLLVTLASIMWGQHLIEQVLTNHVREMVMAEVRAHQVMGQHGNAFTLAEALNERERTAPRRERVASVQDASGKLLYGEPALLSPELCSDMAPPCRGWLRARQASNEGIREWLGYAYSPPDGGRYIIAYDILPMLDRIYPVPLAAGLSVFMVLLAALGVGFYFSLGTLRRIDSIRQAMAHFARGDMSSRVPAFGSKDELDQLGQDVNQALTRINQLMEEVRNATNHIAHELRTPLTRLQQRLSNVSDAVQQDSALCQELALAEEETQRIQYLFSAVMRISEIETGRCQRESESIDVGRLLTDLYEYYGSLAQQQGIGIHIANMAGPTLVGDRALLFQALVNLLDNAIKYSSSGSIITLVARWRENVIELGVADQGPGIAANLRRVAVQRFHRLNRDRTIAGHGLGLALVQAVANLHGGQLLLTDNDLLPPSLNQDAAPRGLLATITIPLPAES